MAGVLFEGGVCLKRNKYALLLFVFMFSLLFMPACQNTDSKSKGLEDLQVSGNQEGGSQENSSEIQGIEEKEEMQEEEKDVVTLGVWKSFRLLDAYIAAFNEEDFGYRIIPRVYYGDGVGKSEEDAMQRMLMELTSGTGPDLVLLDYVDEQSLAQQGYLEDLSVYLAESKLLSKEDFLEGVVNSYTYGGKLVALPRWMAVETLWGKSGMVEEIPDWTVEKMLDLVEKQSSVPLTCDMTREMFLNYCLLFVDKNKLLEIDEGAESFLGRILKQAVTYPEHTSYVQWEEQCWQVRDGEVLLADMTIEYIEQLHMIYSLTDGDELVPIGYPSSDGSPKAILQVVNGLYAIPANAGNKEGAWTFLEHFYAGDLDQRAEKQVSRMLGIPTLKKELEEAVQEEMGKTNVEGKLFLSEEQLRDHVNVLVGMVSTFHASDMPFWNILEEEANIYFKGEKTLEETLQMIENRGSMYLEEAQ